MSEQPSKDFEPLTVVVATRNEEKYISTFLDSLVGQSYKNFVVLIFDGMSTDNTLNIIEKYKNKLKIKVFKNPKVRQVYAFNEGIKEAKTRYFFIIGAHSKLDKDFIKNSYETFVRIKKREAKLAGVGGYLEKVYLNTFGKYVGLLYSSRVSGAGTYNYLKKPGFERTVVYAIYDKDIVEKVGGFDEHFITGQDAELNLRLNKAGYKLYHNPQIKSYHFTRSSFKRFVKQTFNYGVAKGAFIRVGYFSTLWFVPLVLLLIEILALLNLKIFIGLFILYLILITIASFVVLVKKKSILALLLPFGFILFHNVIALGFLKGLIKGRKSFK